MVETNNAKDDPFFVDFGGRIGQLQAAMAEAGVDVYL